MKLQYNQTTGNDYKGMNQAILMAVKDDQDYKSNSWITFVQARTANLKLINAKGKGVHLRTFVDDTDKKGEPTQRPIHFVVFNKDLTKKI